MSATSAQIAKSEGAQAFYDGHSEMANPYAHGTDEHLSWNDGFMEARDAEDELS